MIDGHPRTKDLTGQRFGYLLAQKPVGLNNRNAMVWECLCDCGKITNTVANDLTRGHTKSCGCGGKPPKPMSLKDELDMWKECSYAYQWEIDDLKRPIMLQRALGGINALRTLATRDYITEEIAAKLQEEAGELITEIGQDLDEVVMGWTLYAYDAAAPGLFRTCFEIGQHDFETLCSAADVDAGSDGEIDLSGLRFVTRKGV